MSTDAASSQFLHRILVIKLGDLGDAILATSAIAALRATYPSARIDVLTTSTGAIAFGLCPEIDSVITLDKAAFDSARGLLRPMNSLRMAKLILQLRRRRYDAVVLLQHLTTAAGALKYCWLLRGIGAPLRAGLDNGKGNFLTHRAIDYGFGVKSVHDYNLDVVAQLGAIVERPHPSISIPNADRLRAKQLLTSKQVSGRYVVIHPAVGGYSTARNWYPKRFATVTNEISAKTGLTVLVVGANDASDAASVICASSNAINLVEQTSFVELAAILAAASLVIGADSGVTHLAAALNTPSLTLFGPSNDQAWKPYGAITLTGSPEKLPAARAFVLRSAIPCSPCFYAGYSLGRRDGCALRTCLDRITADSVTNIAIEILASAASSN